MDLKPNLRNIIALSCSDVHTSPQSIESCSKMKQTGFASRQNNVVGRVAAYCFYHLRTFWLFQRNSFRNTDRQVDIDRQIDRSIQTNRQIDINREIVDKIYFYYKDMFGVIQFVKQLKKDSHLVYSCSCLNSAGDRRSHMPTCVAIMFVIYGIY